MFRTLAMTLLLALAACGKDPFGLRDTPRTATEVAYAQEVCDSAGRQSRACIDARHQMDLQCYGTIGTVDCYRSANPFGTTGSDRAVVMPIDRRTAPQPFEQEQQEEEEPEEQAEAEPSVTAATSESEPAAAAATEAATE